MDMAKVQEKNRLAKLLVEQRLAASFDDAVKQIESSGFVETTGEQQEYADLMLKNQGDRSSESQSHPQDAASEQSNDVHKALRKIEYLTKQLQELSNFVQQYKEKNDNNLRELERQISAAQRSAHTGGVPQSPEQRIASQHQQPAQSSEPQPSTAGEKHPQKEIMNDSSQFAVENIFSNAHNKMSKK